MSGGDIVVYGIVLEDILYKSMFIKRGSVCIITLLDDNVVHIEHNGLTIPVNIENIKIERIKNEKREREDRSTSV